MESRFELLGGMAPVRERTLPRIFLLAVTIASAAAMRIVFSPVQELVKNDMRLTDFEISLLQGVAASIPIAILAIPLGRLVDRVNRMRILQALAAVWTLGTAMTVLASTFWELFFARMLAGAGAMSAIPVAISIAADLAPPESRGRSLLLLSLGNMAGAAIAFAGSGPALQTFVDGTAHAALPALAPWRGVHLLFALASGLAMLPLLMMREPARHELGETAGAPVREAARAVWQRRRLLVPLFLGQVTVVMADTAATIWAVPVLTRDYGLQPSDFTGWMGLVALCSGVVGAIVGGVAADFGQSGRIRGGILVGAIAAAVLSLPGAFFPLMPTVTGFALMLALLLTCGAITGLVTATSIAVLVPNEIRGVCLGAFIVISALIGLGIAPTLVTLISGALGGESSLRYALTATTLTTSLVAAVGFITARKAARQSRTAVEGVLEGVRS